MILDGYWKKEIEFQIKIMNNRYLSLFSHDLREHIVNRTLLLTAVAARKAWEDEQWAEQQLDDYHSELLKTTIVTSLFHYIGDPLPPGHVSPIHYINSGQSIQAANHIINAIIHAYYWDLIYGNNNTIEGFAVSSDKFKEQLFFVSIKEWISYLEKVLELSHIC